MTDLEARFEQDMVEKVYRAAGRETGYWAGYFLKSVKRYGGLGAARRSLERGGVPAGLAKLAQLGRLDLAMETLVLDPAYRPLFTDEERALAARRLEDARAAPPHRREAVCAWRGQRATRSAASSLPSASARRSKCARSL